MATTTDWFADVIKNAITFLTDDCWKCGEGECGICKGSGEQKLRPCKEAEDGKIVVSNMPLIRPCPACEGSGHCKECSGNNKIVPHQYSEGVVGMVYAGAIRDMHMSRQQEEFDVMHEVLDHLIAYQNKLFTHCAKEIPDQLEKSLRKYAEIVNTPETENEEPDTSPNKGALTPEELAELGIE